MPRTSRSFPIADSRKFKDAILEWTRSYEKVVWLDSNGHSDKYSSINAVVALSRQTNRSDFETDSIDEAQEFIDKEKDWLFGFITYDFKNKLESLQSNNSDHLDFPELYFFCPEKIIFVKENEAEFSYQESCENEIEDNFLNLVGEIRAKPNFLSEGIRIQMRIHKDAYFEKVNSMLAHIHRGDIYEANFCQEFYSTESIIDPWSTYRNLNQISQPPFATFLRLHNKYLLCASPERYLKLKKGSIVSQPIKGTAKRDSDREKDQMLKIELAQNPKERAENIMITDLVRNDLSKSALKGSVNVDELCKVYTYKQVHQMVSTVTAEVSEITPSTEIIKQTFPMGSMTGAPKVSAMKLIEDLEESKRGLYSGTVGYFGPNGDFDFNVVIRSILYNASKKYVSYSVGSAITAQSIPEKEYEECLIKAKAMRSVLEGENS
ncbi:anthranilate synthase component I family protein [Flagellimonas meridianipacifica]|uniref:Para-aminobenzoate synthetase component 1 n=1 Tax=Flagellimonas meridianipacifica TaxID=1080225 RepID=A0A2T0MB05_9FLAO|nr:anthranilate synthase component I family protein [Allomuricauda pacifica]PRX54693.1 para-aminobenzoate synthetase component 1 [Allomuricauda pacifica]